MPCCFQLRPSYVLWILICFSTIEAVSWIPVDIRDSVAPCAEPCIDSYISDEFTPLLCSTPPTLECLCSQYQNAGSALGSIVTTCTISACLNQTDPPPRISLDYCLQVNRSTTLTTSVRAPTPTMAPLPSDTLPASMSSPTVSASSIANHPPPAGLLSPAQIAGIAVGGAAFAFIVVFMIGWLLSHLHRKKTHRRSDAVSPRLGSVSKASRFGNSEKELAPPPNYPTTFIAEKSTTPPPIRPQPKVHTSYPRLDPSQIGVAVSPESQDPAERAPADKTPISAQSTDSTAKLLPRLPPANLKVAIPRHETQRRRTEGSGPVVEDRQLSSVAVGRMPSPAVSPRSPENSVELPCNNPRRSLDAAMKIKPPAATAARDAPPVPVIKKQAAGRESTQTLISVEPMSPVEQKHTALRPEMAPFAVGDTLDPARGYIPSYYYTNNLTPNQPTVSSPLHQTVFAAPAKAVSPTPSPPREPKTPPNRVASSTRPTPRSTSPTLVSSVSPPTRPQRKTPPPLPPPPQFGAPATSSSNQRSAPPSTPPKTPRQVKPKQRPPPKSQSTRRGARDSASSATSFETTFSDHGAPADDDEATQPLSAVAEATSPISALRYPRVPRPTNQAVSHRPDSPSDRPRSSQSASTLVAKRKGSDAEGEMKRGLWITESNGRTARDRGRFPVRASSRPGSPDALPRPREMAMKSPVWDPTLTPKRTPSGDLVIEVS